MSLNRVTLIGRLGKDVDLRYTPDGTPVANFSAASCAAKRIATMIGGKNV